MPKKGDPLPEHLKKYRFVAGQNLEQHREWAKLGTAACKAAARRRKTIAEILDIMVRLPVEPGEVGDIEKVSNLKEAKEANLPVGELMVLAQMVKAIKGDTRAFEALSTALGDADKVHPVSPLDSLAQVLKAYEEPKKTKAKPEQEPEDTEGADEDQTAQD